MAEPKLRSFRIQAHSKLIPTVCALLKAEGYRFCQEPFSPYCFRLEYEPKALGSSLAAFFGYIYIQDRSSMLPPLALAPSPEEAVLDICASPGSKTSFLGQLKQQQGLVLANEPNPKRLATLRANLHRLNLYNCATCSYEGHKLPLMAGSWDAILLDPPCSGWGTVEKNPKVLQIWSGDNIKRLTSLQRALLRKAYELLKPGGRLLYSTCTTNSAENEEQVRFACDTLGFVCRALTPLPGFVFDEPYPGTLLVNGDASKAQGFFLALLSKSAQEPVTEHAVAKIRVPGYEVTVPYELPEGRTVAIHDNVFFLPKLTGKVLPEALIWRGALLGSLKGGTFQPDSRRKPFALTRPNPETDLLLTDPREITALLSGQTRQSTLHSKEAMLFFQDLPLGQVSIKNGRIVASFR